MAWVAGDSRWRSFGRPAANPPQPLPLSRHEKPRPAHPDVERLPFVYRLVIALAFGVALPLACRAVIALAFGGALPLACRIGMTLAFGGGFTQAGRSRGSRLRRGAGAGRTLGRLSPSAGAGAGPALYWLSPSAGRRRGPDGHMALAFGEGLTRALHSAGSCLRRGLSRATWVS